MMIHAYDGDYLSDAQNVMGHAVDFAVMTLNIDIDRFGDAFAVSNVSKQFAKGNPRYLAGMNGCELARLVLEETNFPYDDADDVMYIERSPEYWCGWALCYYQWYTGRSFMEILKAVPFSKIFSMYNTYHEMDIMQFVDRMSEMLNEAYPLVRLKARRLTCGYSQAELAENADVPLRQIQLFEQRQRDINKTSAITLLKLAKVLHCRMEDLIEIPC